MGCGQSRIVEGSGKENKGFPVCRMTIDLTKLVDSMVAYDKNRIILGARDELQILDYPHKNITPLSKEHKGRINCVIKLSNNEIVTAGQDKTIKVWEINNKSSLMTLSGHTSMIWCLNEISGNKVISGSSDNRAIIWNLNEKKLDFELYKDKEISAVIQLKTGKVLLCSADKLILKGHKKAINSIIELENHRLVSAGDENNMILWNLDDPEAKYFIEGHTNKVSSVALLNGNKFVSVSIDQTLKIWE